MTADISALDILQTTAAAYRTQISRLGGNLTSVIAKKAKEPAIKHEKPDAVRFKGYYYAPSMQLPGRMIYLGFRNKPSYGEISDKIYLYHRFFSYPLLLDGDVMVDSGMVRPFVVTRSWLKGLYSQAVRELMCHAARYGPQHMFHHWFPEEKYGPNCAACATPHCVTFTLPDPSGVPEIYLATLDFSAVYGSEPDKNDRTSYPDRFAVMVFKGY